MITRIKKKNRTLNSVREAMENFLGDIETTPWVAGTYTCTQCDECGIKTITVSLRLGEAEEDGGGEGQ